MRPVGSEFRLGDEGTGDEIFPRALRDVVNRFSAACDCWASNLESFDTLLTLRTTGDSGVPGAEGMGVIRVRFELGGVFRVDKLAARLITEFEIPPLCFPFVWAALNGVPGVPTDEDDGGTAGVVTLAENKGLNA